MLKFGASESDITPKGSIELAGYGYFLNRFSEGVSGKLNATAVAVEGENGKLAILCSVDLVSVDQYTVKCIEDIVSYATGRSDITLLINASHTHSGPATHQLYGAGEYEPEYVDEVVIPQLSETIIEAIAKMKEGEFGTNRDVIPGLAVNRTGSDEIDNALTTFRIDADGLRIAGANFAAHPVVFDKDSRVISSDYPGIVRDVLHANIKSTHEVWQTGFGGDINPLTHHLEKAGSQEAEVAALGMILGHHASALYDGTKTSTGELRTVSTSISLPIDTSFELDAKKETEIYRQIRKIPASQDMSGLTQWYEAITPVVNGNEATTIEVPLTVVAIGKSAFVGLGAEIYSGTGTDLQAAHPELNIIGIMNANEHQGYIARRASYEQKEYGARASSFIFGRKPLTPDSEEILRQQVSATLNTLDKK